MDEICLKEDKSSQNLPAVGWEGNNYVWRATLEIKTDDEKQNINYCVFYSTTK